MRSALKMFPVACLAVFLGSCSLFDDDDLRVTISTDEIVLSPGEELWISVTAENHGNTRISWGEGSTTCQLHLVVRFHSVDHVAPVIGRLCTSDMREMALDPGETETDVLPWTGYIYRDSLLLLPPGKYEIRGAAGDVAKSEPVEIEVVSG